LIRPSALEAPAKLLRQGPSGPDDTPYDALDSEPAGARSRRLSRSCSCLLAPIVIRSGQD